MSSIENWLAVNIALIPDQEGQSYCRRLSEKLASNTEVFLNGKRFPHLTLWMGAVRTDDLKFLKDWTRSVDLKIILHELKIIKVESGSSQMKLMHLVFEESDLIQTLHRTVRIKTEAFEKCPHDAASAVLFAEEVSGSTKEYTRSFHEFHSGKSYSPHITLGYGNSEYEDPKEKLVLDRLGVFLMGDACTCIKEL